MIICSCNAICDDEVRTAARRGCPCPDSAFRSLGCEFQCGSCRNYVAEMIDDERTALLATDARAA